MYINFVVKFIMLVILLYTAFLYTLDRDFGVTNIRKYTNLVGDFFSICTPNLETFKRIINLSNAIDEFSINFKIEY